MKQFTMSRTWFAALVLLGVCVSAQTARELDIAPGQGWVDTGIELKPGDSVLIAATGTLQYAAAKANGPEGISRGWKDLLRMLPLNDAGRGSLIGRVGSNDTAQVFLVGPRKQFDAPRGGKLLLSINQQSNDQATGHI